MRAVGLDPAGLSSSGVKDFQLQKKTDLKLSTRWQRQQSVTVVISVRLVVSAHRRMEWKKQLTSVQFKPSVMALTGAEGSIK